jgi:hypothetical protein
MGVQKIVVVVEAEETLPRQHPHVSKGGFSMSRSVGEITIYLVRPSALRPALYSASSCKFLSLASLVSQSRLRVTISWRDLRVHRSGLSPPGSDGLSTHKR